jgi:hypothetical protein
MAPLREAAASVVERGRELVVVIRLNGPDVWSGRASQEVFVDLSDVGLASMYPASHWSVMLRATVDISAHGVLKTSLMNPKRAYSAFIGGCRIASLIILTGGALVAVLGLWTNETRPSLATDPREGVIESPHCRIRGCAFSGH